MGDAEAGSFAQQITKTLVASGWSVEISKFGMHLPPTYGVHCEVTDRTLEPTAKAMAAAFEKVGIPISFEPVGIHPLPITIFVGLKPPP